MHALGCPVLLCLGLVAGSVLPNQSREDPVPSNTTNVIRLAEGSPAQNSVSVTVDLESKSAASTPAPRDGAIPMVPPYLRQQPADSAHTWWLSMAMANQWRWAHAMWQGLLYSHALQNQAKKAPEAVSQAQEAPPVLSAPYEEKGEEAYDEGEEAYDEGEFDEGEEASEEGENEGESIYEEGEGAIGENEGESIYEEGEGAISENEGEGIYEEGEGAIDEGEMGYEQTSAYPLGEIDATLHTYEEGELLDEEGEGQSEQIMFEEGENGGEPEEEGENWGAIE